MTGEKPLVVYFSDQQEMVDVVSMTLSERFDITPVLGMTSLDEALDTLRQTKPEFVIVDPDLPSLDHQELSLSIKADPELQAVQVLIVRDDVS